MTQDVEAELVELDAQIKSLQQRFHAHTSYESSPSAGDTDRAGMQEPAKRFRLPDNRNLLCDTA